MNRPDVSVGLGCLTWGCVGGPTYYNGRAGRRGSFGELALPPILTTEGEGDARKDVPVEAKR